MDSEEYDAGGKSGGRRFWAGLLISLGLVVVFLGLVVWSKMPPADPLRRAEKEHGFSLPASSKNIQCRGDAWPGFLDRGASTLFEMDESELASFKSGLKITDHAFPAVAGPGDPLINGWNVWPTTAKSFVPGNAQYGGFKRTWSGDAVPVEMLSCTSPVGDWLHVEFWKLPGKSLLVKMFTDWN